MKRIEEREPSKIDLLFLPWRERKREGKAKGEKKMNTKGKLNYFN